MAMPAYPVVCLRPGCGRPAVYKLAARWSDGVTAELKTFALCCAPCLADAFRRARVSRDACRLAPGESLDATAIYRLERGRRDRELERLTDLEAELTRALEAERAPAEG